jgi:predicted lysophospholipase L1 biosynthesis ABC-type transport system permease subunit
MRSGVARTSYTVVGIVNDVQLPGSHTAMKSVQVYQQPLARLAPEYLIRTTRPPAEVVAELRRVVPEIDPHTVLRVAIGDEYLRDSMSPTRFAMALLCAFSIVALVLAGVGLYGVIAYSVSQRTREIGIRIALGAEAGAVTRLVMSDGLRLAVIGVVLGGAAAAAVTRALRSMLYAVTPDDPVTFAAIAVLVGAMALVASYVPARRALGIDPTEALRAE